MTADPALTAALRRVLPTEEAGKAFVRAEAAKLKAPGSKWHRSPTAYADDVLGIRLTTEQSDIVECVAENTLTSWRSGQKLGKSTVISVLGLWWPDTRDAGLCVMTSGNASQVRIILWRELRRLHAKARIPIGGSLHLSPENGLTFDDGRATVGLTADQPERLQGYSGAKLLFLVDEASGFSDELLEAVLGNLAGGGQALLCGNPTKTVGLFARTHRNRIVGWKLKHTSAYDSPNVKADLAIEAMGAERDADAVERIEATRVPGLARLDWVRQMAETFGADSAAFAVRVKGEFAEEGDDATVPLALVTAAVERWTPDHRETGVLELGVDPARFGDDETSITPKRGMWSGPSLAVRKLDNVEVAAVVLLALFGDVGKVDVDAETRVKLAGMVRGESWARVGEKPIVRVDVGGLGAGVVDILKRDQRLHVVAVNAGASSRHEARFHDTRAELWWCARRWLERGGMMPEDEKRDAELFAAKHFTDTKMRVQVASKDDMKKALGRSPDRADSLCLACYGESPLEAAERPARTSHVAQPGRQSRPHDGIASGLPEPASAGRWQPGMGRPRKRYE